MKGTSGIVSSIALFLVLLAALSLFAVKYFDMKPGGVEETREGPRSYGVTGIPGQTIRTDEGILVVDRVVGNVEFQRGSRLVPVHEGDKVVSDTTVYFGRGSFLMLKGKDGERISLMGSSSRLIGEGGRVLCVIDVNEDRYKNGKASPL